MHPLRFGVWSFFALHHFATPALRGEVRQREPGSYRTCVQEVVARFPRSSPNVHRRDGIMPLGDGIRRNAAKMSQAERDHVRDAFLKLDTIKVYPDGVTYWDKQEEIHKAAHAGGQDVHTGPAFTPWHRELINRLEALLRQVDPLVSLPY